jgi:hypothetical protein
MRQWFHARSRPLHRQLMLAPAFALLLLAGGSSRPSEARQAEPRKMVPGIKARLRAVLKNPNMKLLILEGTFVQGKGRLDVIGSTGAGDEVQPQEYLLLGDSTARVVNYLDKTWRDQAPYDIGSLVAMVNAIDRGTNVSNPKIKWDTLPPETLNGIKTRHYSFDVEYGLPARVAGQDIAAITRAKGEYWVADMPINFYNPFAGLARPKGAFGGEQAPAIAALYSALRELNVGTVLKFRAQGIIGEGTERPTIYIRTIDVTNIQNVEVDPAIFDIPGDYRQIGNTGGGRGPGGRGGRGGAGADTTGGRGRGADTTAGRGRGADTTSGRGRGRGGDTTTTTGRGGAGHDTLRY